MSCIKDCASSFPLFAASEISDLARPASYSVPCPSAQHLASMSMDSVSPVATQSSRSATAFGWFCGTPFPSISRFASSFFASMSPCDTRTLCLFARGAFTFFLRVICVLFECLLFFVVLLREKEKKRGEVKEKRRKGRKELFFVLCVWAFGMAAFLFLLSPKTLFLSFSSLSSLCVLPIPSCQQHHSHTDWTGRHGHKEPLPFL